VRSTVGADGSDLAGSLCWVLGELVRVGQVGRLGVALSEDDFDGGPEYQRLSVQDICHAIAV
jgi:hypothetical protein